jgi:hypothetical protein
MHRAGDDMTNEQVSDPHLPPVQTLQEHPEPGPEEYQSRELEREPLVPRHLEREITVRVGVQVESSKGEDDVVDLVPADARRRAKSGIVKTRNYGLSIPDCYALNLDHHVAKPIERHDPLVIRRPEVAEKLGRDGEKGNMLDVWIMFRVVRDDYECGGG